MELRTIAWVLAAALAALSAPCVLYPAQALDAIRRFPRNRPLGWVLAAVALLWSAWLVFHMSMESFDKYKPLLYVLTPLAFVLVVLFVDDLLAARAFGGLLALIPAPMLDAAQWHESPWRFVVVVLAYVMALAGMALILSPYHLRKFMERFAGSPATCFRLGSAGCALAAALLLLGLLAY